MAPSLAEWLDPRLAARHDVRVGVEFPAERIEGLMSVSAQVYALISFAQNGTRPHRITSKLRSRAFAS